MTTEEYLKELENDVKKLEIRKMCEIDPHKKDTIQKDIDKRSNYLKEIRKLWGNEIQYAILEHKNIEGEENNDD